MVEFATVGKQRDARSTVYSDKVFILSETCYMFWLFPTSIIRHRVNSRRENKHMMYKTLVAERGIFFSFLQMFM
jgi:hypothetical protein